MARLDYTGGSRSQQERTSAARASAGMSTDVGGGSLQEQHMANVYADPYQEPIQTIDRMQAAIDASKARDAERYALAAQQAVDLDRLRAAEQAEAISRGAADLGFGLGYMPPAYSEPEFYRSTLGAVDLGYGPGYMPPVKPTVSAMPTPDLGLGLGASFGAVTYPELGAGFGASLGALTYPTLPQDQQAAITRYLERGRATGLGGMLSGGVYDRIASGGPEMEPVFGPSGEVIGVRHPGFIPGTRVYSGQSMGGGDDDQPQITSTVTNPATGREECPDGYIFDEDLNACRLDTRGGTTTAPDAPAAPGVPGAQYARMGLLDVAPEGLMGFQERYGAGFGTPADFGAANLAFRQQGAISPEYYQTPPKLTGYTLLG